MSGMNCEVVVVNKSGAYTPITEVFSDEELEEINKYIDNDIREEYANNVSDCDEFTGMFIMYSEEHPEYLIKIYWSQFEDLMPIITFIKNGKWYEEELEWPAFDITKLR